MDKNDKLFIRGLIPVAVAVVAVVAVGIWAKSRRHVPKEERVWICTGPQSKRYHNDIECKGLDSCSGDTKYITITQAQDMGRTPCPYCYEGVVPDW